MESNRFESWLQNIYETQDEEISCTECFDLVSHFVELELSGGDPAIKMPQVKQHLDQCLACRDEYVALRDLRRLEDEAGAPPVDDLRDLIP
jgi:predicted anti-sigma-YlaC factor YlaD